MQSSMSCQFSFSIVHRSRMQSHFRILSRRRTPVPIRCTMSMWSDNDAPLDAIVSWHLPKCARQMGAETPPHICVAVVGDTNACPTERIRSFNSYWRTSLRREGRNRHHTSSKYCLQDTVVKKRTSWSASRDSSYVNVQWKLPLPKWNYTDERQTFKQKTFSLRPFVGTPI